MWIASCEAFVSQVKIVPQMKVRQTPGLKHSGKATANKNYVLRYPTAFAAGGRTIRFYHNETREKKKRKNTKQSYCSYNSYTASGN